MAPAAPWSRAAENEAAASSTMGRPAAAARRRRRRPWALAAGVDFGPELAPEFDREVPGLRAVGHRRPRDDLQAEAARLDPGRLAGDVGQDVAELRAHRLLVGAQERRRLGRRGAAAAMPAADVLGSLA